MKQFCLSFEYKNNTDELFLPATFIMNVLFSKFLLLYNIVCLTLFPFTFLFSKLQFLYHRTHDCFCQNRVFFSPPKMNGTLPHLVHDTLENKALILSVCKFINTVYVICTVYAVRKLMQPGAIISAQSKQ